MFLEAKDLRVHYDRIEALRGISFHVDEGEIVTLLGRNGAGKSTTLMSICKLVPINSGEVWFKGERIDTLSTIDLVRREMGICLEGRRLFPFMTVMENLLMGAYSRKDKKKEIAKDIENIFNHFPRLAERRKQRADGLSGGEQQMVALGRALMSRPRLLLLDEPSLGLAPLMVNEICEIIKVIRRSGVSIFWVEQNARAALDIADRGYVIETGSVVLEGNAKDLQNNEFLKSAYLGHN
jgi:branched-chain amino acid transport system ATP-binding protein